MTKKEKKQLAELQNMMDIVMDIVNTTDALSTGNDGGETENAAVLHSWLGHIKFQIDNSMDNGTLEILYP